MGRRFAWTPETAAIGVDAVSSRRKYTLPWRIPAASLSPDRRSAAAVCWVYSGTPTHDPAIICPPLHEPTTIALWNFADGTQPRAVVLPYSEERPTGTFSPDSRFFVSTGGTDNRHVYVIDVQKTEIKSSFTLDAPIKGLFALDSGEIAAIGVEPGAILVWKIKTP